MSRIFQIMRSVPTEDWIVGIFAVLSLWFAAAVISAITP